MADKNVKISQNSADVVQLLDDEEVKTEYGEAFASIMLNPTVTWAKFVLTDDGKNANGQRIPKSEFANLIKSGLHMPVKMAFGEVKPGHDDSKPLGTITHLKEMDIAEGGTAIVALAALWGDERPADVQFIKEKFNEKQPINISWEIKYTNDVFNPAFGSMDLLGTVLQAATIVGNPAYKGRTPFLAVAAKKEEGTTEPVATTPETIAEDNSMEVKELEAKVADLEAKLAEANTKLTETEAKVTELTETVTTKETELEPLREFKASIEAEKQKTEKLENIKTKFSEAGIEKDATFFDGENAEKLLAMSEDTFSFMLQELKAFASTKESKASDEKKIRIPNLTSDDTEDLSDPKVLGKMLRDERGKK